MKKVYQGIIEENIIRLKQKVGLPIGTETIVILKTMENVEQNEITDRQLKLLDKGFCLGKKLYKKREDLYAKEAN